MFWSGLERMTSESPLDASARPALAEAMAWFIKLNAGQATDAELVAFKHWRNADTTHDAAFRRLLIFQKAAHRLPENVVQFPAKARATRRAFLAGGSVAAAAAACALAVMPPMGLWPSLADLMADHRTGPGDRFAFAPSSGVKVEMNTRTSVAMEDNGHAVRLVDGEAYFKIDDSKDFAVRASGIKVSARSAQFNVRTEDGALVVTCIAGEAICSTGSASLTAAANEQIAIHGDGGLHKSPVDAALVTAWRQGLLIFNSTPLRQVVAEINRYRPGRIILTDPKVASMPINGVFHTAHIENTVAQIRKLLGVHITRLPGGVVLMG